MTVNPRNKPSLFITSDQLASIKKTVFQHQIKYKTTRSRKHDFCSMGIR